MKVDKAVCTKDTQKDLNKTIQYETVFTTLVENKILAIKRECESKKKIKKHKKSSKTFGKFFFGKRIFGERKDIDNNEEIKVCSECVIDIEKDEIKNAAIVDNQNMMKTTIDMGGEDIIKVTSIHNAIIADTNVISAATDTIIIEDRNMQKKSTIEIDSDDETSVTIHKYTKNLRNSLKDDSNGSNGNGSLDDKGVRNMVVEVITHRQGQSYDDNNGYGNNNENKMKMIEINESEQHIDSSSLGSVRIDESTNADDSLTSVKDSVESISFPSSYCTISAGVATVSNERESSRLRVLEAKSISAQCSPILARQSKSPSACFAQTQTYHPKLLESQVSYSDNHRGNYDYHGRDALRFFSRQNTSEDSVNLTVSTLLHEADSINALGERKSKSTSLLVITDKENKKPINRLDSSSIVSNQSNPLVRGFISSLNQLTTTSNYFPVITTTITALRSKASVSKTIDAVVDPLPTKSILAAVTTTPTITTTTAAAAISSYDTAKLQRMTSTSTGSSVAPTGCCNTKAFSKDKDKRQKPLCHTRQSGSDDEYRKRKRKYKRYHRCSDPVLVYPSTGELQHCILSMPPNQPIQFYYNDDFLYDMTLQVEADQNGDLQAIVPSHRSKRHTHHRHKKRNRHNKPKILVHDLDTQSVKVIDPDDLPQRARWTIIATACLLLLMCLMLVGITLRMAPIIDDMGLYHGWRPNHCNQHPSSASSS